MSIDYLTGRTPTSGKVTPLISGAAYFDDFFNKLNSLNPGDKMFLLNWHINLLFNRKTAPDDDELDEKAANDFLLTRLQQLVDNEVDVRILLWINTNMFEPLYPLKLHEKPQVFIEGVNVNLTLEESVRNMVKKQDSLPFKGIMTQNLYTVFWWREQKILAAEGDIYEPESVTHSLDASLKHRIVINTLDSMAGGVHTKFALFLQKNSAGEYIGTGYTGGIDLAPGRYAKIPYTGFYVYEDDDGKEHTILGNNFWHDIMAKVEGTDAVEPLFYFYRNLWNENILRKNDFNPRLSVEFGDSIVRIPCVPDGGTLIGEVDFDLGETHDDHLIQSVSTVPNTYPISGEPEISFAPDGNFEFRDSIYHAFKQAESYIYVEDQAMESLELFGLIKDALIINPDLVVILITGGDPADEPISIDKKLINKFHYSELEDEQKERLRFYQANYTIHSKLFIIDDEVAIIGSGGFFTRSMTEELEHAVAYIDQSASNSIKSLRETLWELHTGIDGAALHPNITDALTIWDEESFGNTDKYDSDTGLSWIDLDENVFVDISEFWHEIPFILKKKATDPPLTDEEQEKLDTFGQSIKELGEAIFHLATHEIPYSSFFNPSQLPPVVGIPFIENEKIAVNEKANLELISSQLSNVAWEYVEIDGTPQTGTGDEFEIQFSTPGIKMVLATQTFDESNIEQRYPFTLEVLENSGPDWVNLFTPSVEVSDLSDVFRPRVEQFIAASEEAGLMVTIFSTFRPSERAYLMAYAYKISKGLNPTKVKRRLDNVNIAWTHFDSNGDLDLTASRQAAQEMVDAYDIGSTGAVYPSHHSEGNAIDMHVAIPNAVMMRDGKGNLKRVKKQGHLTRIALSYGIRRLGSSSHWSLNGH